MENSNLEPAVPPARSSLMQRLMNVFVAPGEAFDDIKSGIPSSANWIVPLVLAMIVGVVFVEVAFSQPAVIQGMRDAQQQQFQKQVQDGKMTQEQADKAAEATSRFMTPTMFKLFGFGFAVLGSAVWLFFIALILWLLGKWPLRSSFPYLQALEAAGLATMITILGALIGMLLTVWKGNMAMTLSPALFVQDFDQTKLSHQILLSLNVMTIWYVSVLSIGLSRLSGRSFGSAAACMFGLWLLVKLVQFGWMAAFAAMS